MKYFELDGIKIISSDTMEIRDYLRYMLDSPKTNLIITFNIDFYRIASENEIFHRLCKNAGTVIPDGAGIVHLIDSKYNIRINRITGNDLFTIILSLSNEINIKAAFVGSSPAVLDRLKKRLCKEYPKLKIAAAISPPPLFEKDYQVNKSVIDELKGAKPDILFVALGCPRQELWIQDNMKEIGSKINIGVGAVFDFYSGVKRRSPVLFQNLSLEWMWRLFHEPVRLSRRYLYKDIPFYLKKRFLTKERHAKR